MGVIRTTISVRDEKGGATTVRPFLPDTLSIGDALAEAIALVAPLRGVTDGAVYRVSVSVSAVVNPLARVSPRPSPWLLLLLRDTGGNVDAEYVPRVLPEIVDALAAAPGTIPDEVQAFYDALVSAGFVSSAGLPFAEIVAALIVESEGE